VAMVVIKTGRTRRSLARATASTASAPASATLSASPSRSTPFFTTSPTRSRNGARRWNRLSTPCANRADLAQAYVRFLALRALCTASSMRTGLVVQLGQMAYVRPAMTSDV
jgi:hypothetical protein